MQKDIEITGKGLHQAKRPKANDTFKSVKEYISQLKEFYRFSSKGLYPKLTEKQFIHILGLFDSFCESEYYAQTRMRFDPMKIKEVKSLDDFYKILNSFITQLPSYSYKNKTLRIHDDYISGVNQFVMSLNLYHLYKWEKHLSKSLFRYLMWTFKSVMEQADQSELYESERLWYKDYIEESMDNYEEYDEATKKEFQRFGKSFKKAFDKLEKVNTKPRKVVCANELENQIKKMCDFILSYNPYQMVDVVDGKQAKIVLNDIDEYNGTQTEHKRTREEAAYEIIQRFYLGYYIITYDEYDFSENEEHPNFVSHYLSHMNSYENESWWYSEFETSFIVDEKSVSRSSDEIVKNAIRYMDTFDELNNLLSKNPIDELRCQTILNYTENTAQKPL